MAETTNTGSVPTTTGSVAIDRTQRRVYRTTDGVTETTLITRGEYKAYRSEGWGVLDPAFIPDPDLTKIATDGLVPMRSNLGGIPKQVNVDEVTWYQQNGWTVDEAPAATSE